MRRHALMLVPAAALAAALTTVYLHAGPLNPPPGPVASTYKTLTEVEPRTAVSAANTPGDADSHFKISLPGSYYLTGNIVGTARAHGIEIAADNVTLDLMGFSITHAGEGLDGISTAGVAHSGVTIRNGVVAGWGTGGIDLEGGGHTVESVHARQNNGIGIAVGGTSQVSRCEVSGNSGLGIAVLTNASITDCVANFNTLGGFSAGDGSVLTACSATANSQTGILVTEGCTLTDCTAKSNGALGIDAGGACSITGCAATDNATVGIRSVDTGLDDGGSALTACSSGGNGSDGFVGSIATSYTGCSARRNTGVGFVVGIGGTASGCSASFNTGGGFTGSIGASFDACSAFNNGGVGFALGNSGAINRSNSRANSFDGITAINFCVITGNTCSGNGPTPTGGSGILVSGTDCRIEANNCDTNADFGIEVLGSGNIILRNTCSGNGGNWSVAANNYYGPILNRVGVATAAQAGNGSGTDGLTSTHPNANFSY